MFWRFVLAAVRFRKRRLLLAFAGLMVAATLATALLYTTAATAAGWLSLRSASVIPAIFLQQALIFAAVLLRLWMQASTVVLWRRVMASREPVAYFTS